MKTTAAKDRSLLKIAFGLAFLGAVLLWALFIAGCGYAKHIDPQLYTYDTASVTAESARLHAVSVNGFATTVTCCGSMQPLIQNGDILVVAPSAFGPNLLGKVVVYLPKWNNGGRVAHRLVAAEDGGYIASGDNNATSEPQEPVTRNTFIGEVVAIYRTTP